MVMAGDFDVMSYLWEEFPKAPDADHVTLSGEDVALLWHMGFVDTVRVSFDQWCQLFDDNFHEGKYVLSRDEFFSMDQYRFTGELYAPFDAMAINEGQYTDEGFQDLVAASITPSCGLSASELGKLLDDLKGRMRQPNGLLEINPAVKREIALWLNEHPSPLRRLEITFTTLLDMNAIPYESSESPSPTPPSTAVRPEHLAKIQASTFSLMSTSPEATRRAALKNLEKARLPEAPVSSPTKESVPLKSIQRNRRGPRG